MATQSQIRKAHLIIHAASMGAASVAGSLAQTSFFGIDLPVINAIQIAMIISLAQIFNKNITHESAVAYLGLAVGNVAHEVAVWGLKGVIGAIPIVGNIANATIGASSTEAIGWWCFYYFDDGN